MEEQLVAISSALADDFEAGHEPNVERLESLLTPGDGLRIISTTDGVIIDRGPGGDRRPDLGGADGPEAAPRSS